MRQIRPAPPARELRRWIEPEVHHIEAASAPFRA
jgi:hypothetical protein